MKYIIKIALIFSLLIYSQTELFAQIKVTGTVSDPEGFTLPGATVMVKGGKTATSADLDGKYTISVSSEDAILIFSYIGYQNVEERVGKKAVIDVSLPEDTMLMDEVIVVGYGTMSKADITGSITSIKADVLEATHAQSITAALQGQAAGVYVSTTSAAPGGASTIRIRGTNSLLADANPLYVVDGFPVDANDVNNMDLASVASVEILKDAASTAIYGSRGANGVILIQTNMGAKSAPKFSFSANGGIQEIYRKVDLLNGQEFAEIFNDYRINEGYGAYYDGSRRDRPTPQQIGEGTDWFDQITQLGYVQNYNLSVQGGTDIIKYRIGGSYYQNEGVIKGGSYDRMNLNMSNTVKLTKWLDLQTNIALSHTDTDGSGDRTGLETSSGTLNNAIKMSPTINVYDAYGNYNPNSFPGAQSNENPLAYANEVLDKIKSNVAIMNTSFNFKPLKGLELQAKFGANVRTEKGTAHLSVNTIEGAKVNGRASISNASKNDFTNEYIANYKRTFGKKHQIFLTGAFSLEANNYEHSSITGTGLVVDDLSYAGISSAEIVSQPTMIKYASSMMSALGRINYVYDERLILTLTNRADGNSSFSAGNKWGNFPSVAGSWIISREKFMSNIEAINTLKLRASWGLTGNSKIGNSRSLSLLENDRYPFGGDVNSGMGPGTIGNPNLKWETTEMYNIGVDLALWENRLRVSAEVYYKYTSDMLMSYDIPTTSGFDKAYINAGELENKGLEVSVSGLAIDYNNFKWTIGGNFSLNRDKVTKLYNDQPLIIDLGDKQSITIKEGQPIRQFQSAEILGIFKDQAEVDAHTWTDPETGITKPIQGNNVQPGDIKYRDVNNDGKIDVNDNVIYGSAFPDFTYALNSKFIYKGFSLDVFLLGSEGNWVQNRTLGYLRNTKDIRNNLSAEMVNRWTPENTNTNIPRIGAPDNLPTFEDASYLRIQNVNLSYTFPKKLIKGFDALSLSFSIENLYIWTKYSGWDPDVNSAYGGSGNINVGTDTNSYPKPRTYRLGVNLKF